MTGAVTVVGNLLNTKRVVVVGGLGPGGGGVVEAVGDDGTTVGLTGGSRWPVKRSDS